MNVYCLACGAEFATTLSPGEHGYPLNNGVCHPCVREARKPNHRLLAENERLRMALRRIERGHYSGPRSDGAAAVAREALGDE